MSSDDALTILDSLRSADGQSVSQQVDSFHKHVTRNLDEVDDVLWDSWNRVFDIAERTPPEEQGGLDEFLVRLRGLGDKGEDGEMKVYEADGGKLWGDMPAFGWVARDKWNFGKELVPPPVICIPCD